MGARPPEQDGGHVEHDTAQAGTPSGRAVRTMTVPPVGRRAGRGQVTTYGEGRTCAEPDCGTKLSRYNGTSFCGAHNEAGGAARQWHA